MAEVKCEVFGDEGTSANQRYALYSFIGFEPAKVERALAILSRTKERFGVSNAARLHCRELFAGERRAKTEWRVIKPKEPIEVCRYLTTELLSLRPLWAYGYLDMGALRELPDPTTMRTSFPARDGSPGVEDAMRFGDGQAQRFAYLAAGWTFQQRFWNTARFWVDQDTTKLDWLNGKKGQAHNLNPILPCSTALPPGWSPMLEIADVFAYAAGRCLANDQRYGAGVFRTIHRRYGPIVSKMNMDPTAFGAEIDRAEWVNAVKTGTPLP
jgi:hypothetical protein